MPSRTPPNQLTALLRRMAETAVATATTPIDHGSFRNAREAVATDRMRARARHEAMAALDAYTLIPTARNGRTRHTTKA